MAKLLAEAVDDAVAAQPTGGNPQPGVEFVQVPTQPVDHPGALTHEIPAVIDQQLDLPGGTVQLSDRKPVAMAQDGQRDRFGVDRVRLTRLTSRSAGRCHQPSRYPHQSMPGREQIALDPTGHIPAVLAPQSSPAATAGPS